MSSVETLISIKVFVVGVYMQTWNDNEEKDKLFNILSMHHNVPNKVNYFKDKALDVKCT